MLQNTFSWTSMCASSESNKNAIVKGKSCTLSWPDINEKKVAIKHVDGCSTERRRNAHLQESGTERKQRWAEGDHPTEHFSLSGLAKTVTYTWNRTCPREQGISPSQLSNRFALIPHFITTKSASDSCWKSPIFLFGLTVSSARPVYKKELATLI